MQLVANYGHTPSQVCTAVYCDTLCHQLIICQSWLTFIGLKEIHLMRIGHRVVGCRPSIRSTVPRTAARLPLSDTVDVLTFTGTRHSAAARWAIIHNFEPFS